MIRRLWAVSVAVWLMASPVKADDDKSQYSLFNPTPKEKMRSFATDRPTKSNVPWTVDAGHFQYEGDVFIYSFDGSSTFDANITTITLANPTFKLGLTNFMDFEVNFSAYNNVRTEMRSAATSTAVSGFGDTFTRLKINLFGNDGGNWAMALIPYAKWPTAPVGIGNRYVEGGLIAPLAVTLPAGFNLILMGEFDYQKNPNDPMYHANFPALINVSKEIFSGVTLYAELYANWTTHQDVRDLYSLDFAVAWSPLPNFQLDLGVNIGLNPWTPGHQIYVGISQRF